MAKQNAYRSTRKASPRRRGIPLPARGLAVFCGLCAILCVVFLVSVGLVAGYRWATSTRIFAVRTVQVDGLQRLGRAEVIDRAGLERFGNLLDISLWKVKKDLLQEPWIKSVSLGREFPHTLSIQVQEKIPVFWRQQGGRIYYADKQGEIIAPVRAKNFVSLPLLVCDPNLRRDQRDLAIVNQDLSERRTPFSLAGVAWIRFADNGRVDIGLLKYSFRVVVGREKLKSNMRKLSAIWRDVRRRGELDQVVHMYIFDGTGWVGYRSDVI